MKEIPTIMLHFYCKSELILYKKELNHLSHQKIAGFFSTVTNNLMTYFSSLVEN